MYSVVTMVTSEEGSDKYAIVKRVEVTRMLKQTKFITDYRWSQRLCGGSASPRKFVEDSKRVGLCSLTHTPPAFSNCSIKSWEYHITMHTTSSPAIPGSHNHLRDEPWACESLEIGASCEWAAKDRKSVALFLFLVASCSVLQATESWVRRVLERG